MQGDHLAPDWERWAEREGSGRSLSAGVHGAPGGAEEVDAEDYGEDERQNRHGDVQG